MKEVGEPCGLALETVLFAHVRLSLTSGLQNPGGHVIQRGFLYDSSK